MFLMVWPPRQALEIGGPPAAGCTRLNSKEKLLALSPLAERCVLHVWGWTTAWLNNLTSSGMPGTSNNSKSVIWRTLYSYLISIIQLFHSRAYMDTEVTSTPPSLYDRNKTRVPLFCGCIFLWCVFCRWLLFFGGFCLFAKCFSP